MDNLPVKAIVDFLMEEHILMAILTNQGTYSHLVKPSEPHHSYGLVWWGKGNTITDIQVTNEDKLTLTEMAVTRMADILDY